MSFNGFKKKDFNTFKIDGLEKRMAAIQEHIQPKFEELSHYLVPELNAMTGNEMYTHIARHARRTVNPPDDTWVAFADNRRGYKQHPHFQVGLWESHLFIWFAMIYESPYKKEASKEYLEHLKEIYDRIPSDFAFSEDHTKPEYHLKENCSLEDIKHMAERLGKIKKAEFLCGKIISKEEAIKLSGKKLKDIITDTYKTVQPLYEMAEHAKSRS